MDGAGKLREANRKTEIDKNMRILLLTILVGVILLTSASAQATEQQAAKIRALYAATNKRIDDGLKDDKTLGLHYAAWTIGGERDGQQWAAVGTMKSVAEFYFDGDPRLDENAKRPDARSTIRKIVSTYAGAADLRTRSEYLFDAAGSLVFALTSELQLNGATTERRFYYARGKLIRVAREGKNIDGKFGNEDARLAANAQADAKRLQNIFALLFAE